MQRRFTLEYWLDDDWFVGKLKELPGIFSQGETLEELEKNIQEVYQLMMDENKTTIQANIQTKELVLET